jgi:O-antigen ligase
MILIMLGLAIMVSSNPLLAVVLSAVLLILGGGLHHGDEFGPARIGLLLLVALVSLSSLGKFGVNEPGFTGGGPLTLTKFIGFFCLVYVLWAKTVLHSSFVSNRQTWLLLAFSAAVVLSLIVNGSSIYTVRALRGYFSAFVVFLLIINVVRDERDIMLFIVFLAGGYVLSALLGFTGGGQEAARFRGMAVGSAVAYGMGLAGTAVIALYYAIKLDHKLYRVMLAGAFFILLYALVATYARSVYMGLAIGVGIVLFKLRKRLTFPGVAIAALLAIGFFVVFVDLDRFGERIMAIGASKQVDWSYFRRWSYYLVFGRLILTNPLLGIGPGNFPAYYTFEAFRNVAPTFQTEGRSMHNMYISVICDAGVIGFVFYVLVILYTLRDLRFVNRSYAGNREPLLAGLAEAMEVALYVVLFIAFFNPMHYDKLIWVLLALSVAAARIRREQVDTGTDRSNLVDMVNS